uniref:Uncharacterized protein n=1 Tax=Rhizophora mucronata TaxID=61149 RepID=A0A2P2PLH5_RHIMU
MLHMHYSINGIISCGMHKLLILKFIFHSNGAYPSFTLFISELALLILPEFVCMLMFFS